MESIRRRTPEEIKAYIDGYNTCYKRFLECLKKRKSVSDSIKRMKVFVDLVNSIVVMRGEQDDEQGSANND